METLSDYNQLCKYCKRGNLQLFYCDKWSCKEKNEKYYCIDCHYKDNKHSHPHLSIKDGIQDEVKKWRDIQEKMESLKLILDNHYTQHRYLIKYLDKVYSDDAYIDTKPQCHYIDKDVQEFYLKYEEYQGIMKVVNLCEAQQSHGKILEKSSQYYTLYLYCNKLEYLRKFLDKDHQDDFLYDIYSPILKFTNLPSAKYEQFTAENHDTLKRLNQKWMICNMDQNIIDLEVSNRNQHFYGEIFHILYKALYVTIIFIAVQFTGGLFSNFTAFMMNANHLALCFVYLIYLIKDLKIMKERKKAETTCSDFILGILLFAIIIVTPFYIIKIAETKKSLKIDKNIWVFTSIISLIFNISLHKILVFDEANCSISEFAQHKVPLDKIHEIRLLFNINLCFQIAILLGYFAIQVWSFNQRTLDAILSGIILFFGTFIYMVSKCEDKPLKNEDKHMKEPMLDHDSHRSNHHSNHHDRHLTHHSD